MATEPTNGSRLSKHEIDTAVREALVNNGWVLEDGTIDRLKFREGLCDYLAKHAKVLDKKDRADKAKTKGTITGVMFPKTPKPDDGNGDALALAVWAEQMKFVWNELRTAADSPLQRMVAVNMGNGYVLVRTKVGRDRVDAAYITDNYACIRQDFTRPENESLARKLDTARKNREMLILRQPEHADDFAKEYDATVKHALAAANASLQLTVESVTSDGNDDIDADEDDGDDA